jgi:hypothetical protein
MDSNIDQWEQQESAQGRAQTSGTSSVCLVHLVSLVHLVYPVSLVQPNKRDKPNRPNEQDRLADFFSILLARNIHECRREAFETEARRGFSQVRPT